MTRLLTAIACIGLSVLVTTASAQSYPYQQSYPGYGYGQPAYGDPTGGAPYDASQAMYYQQAMHQQMPAPGRMPKLPRGVSAENGLLFYNGRPYADAGGQPGFNPYQQAAYQQEMQSGMGPAPMSCTATEGGAYDPNYGYGGYGGGPYGGQMGGYGQMGDGYGGPDGAYGNCNDGSDGHHGLLWGLFHHNYNPFPGKMGYVWSGGFDALGMNRTAGTDRVLVLDTNTLAPLFNSSEFAFPMTPGGRAFVQLMGPSGISYQAVYMRLATFVADATVVGDNNLQIPFPLASATTDFFGADRMSFHYLSDIQGVELNAIIPYGNFQWILGYRYLQIDESLLLQSIDIQDAFESDFTTTAFNALHGIQIGAQGQWSLFDLVNFDFWAKFGVYGDIAGQHQIVRDLNNTVVFRDTRGRDTATSLVTDVGVQVVMPLGSSWSLHGGYSAMIINDIALAPDQMDFNINASAGTRVNTKSDLVLHGVNVGLTAVW
jgi:hypothetical protein